MSPKYYKYQRRDRASWWRATLRNRHWNRKRFNNKYYKHAYKRHWKGRH